jgi:hypothetical protein
MKNNTVTTLDSIKEQIIDRLQDYKGGLYYGCDLAYKLFEGENANGSVFCNTYKTVEFIKENFDLFGDFVQHWDNATGETLNPFSEPEKCHVIFLLEAANSILSSCGYISENWDNRIELTEDVIETITEQVNEFDGDLF